MGWGGEDYRLTIMGKSKRSRRKPFKRSADAPAAAFPLQDGAAIFVIAVVVFIVFANSIGNQFAFDDKQIIVQNQLITSLKNIPRILGLTSGHIAYRPIRDLSYTIDYFFFGLNPVGYHLFNIFYHIVASIFAYLALRLLTKSDRIALFGAILFAVHPVQTDSVTYLSGRRDVLCGLFYLMGFYYFLKYRRDGRHKYIVIAFAAYLLGMFSKEMAVTLPAIFFAYDFVINLQEGPFYRKIPSTIYRVFARYRVLYPGLFTVAGLFVFYKVVINNPSLAKGYYGGDFTNDMLTAATIFAYYIKLLVFPLTLSADYSYNAFPVSTSLFEPATLFSVLFLLALFVLIVALLTEKNRLLAFGGMWFFITLLPVAQIFPHHELMAVHYLYIPMFGFVLVVAALFDRALTAFPQRRAIYAGFVLIALLLSVRTIVRNGDWKNDLTLWTTTVATSPNCARARNNLGQALVAAGDPAAAIAQYRQALEIKPAYPEVYCNLGVAYAALGKHELAKSQFEKALRQDPDFAPAYYNLGVYYAERGELQEALRLFKKTVAIRPGLISAHFNLGLAYDKLDDKNRALQQFRLILTMNPDTAIADKTKAMISKLETE